MDADYGLLEAGNNATIAQLFALKFCDWVVAFFLELDNRDGVLLVAIVDVSVSTVLFVGLVLPAVNGMRSLGFHGSVEISIDAPRCVHILPPPEVAFHGDQLLDGAGAGVLS